MAETPSAPDSGGSRPGRIGSIFQLAQAAVQRIYETMHQLFGSDDLSTEAPQCNGTTKGEDGPSDINLPFSSLAIGDLPLPTRVSKAGPPDDPLAQQQGKIEWVHTFLYQQTPEWRCEPDTSVIKHIVTPHLEAYGLGLKDISVDIFAAGAFNKLYTVRSLMAGSDQRNECIFRVAMPIHPWYKTESEVATMEYVRRYTSIPVPKVYAFDSSNDNALGLEWIMMEKMAGRPIGDYWDMYEYEFDRFDMNTKLHIARGVAEWVHELSKIVFDKIGSLYIDWGAQERCFKLGPLVYGDFFSGERLAYRAYRGPFKDTEQFYRSLIDIQLQDILNPVHRTRFEARMQRIEEMRRAEAEGQKAEKESDRASSCTSSTDTFDLRINWYSEEDFTNVPRDCHALQSVLPLILPQDARAREPMTLYHFDMSSRNVLVDDCGNLVGLVDWEMIGTRPYDQLRELPPFIDNDGHDITTLSDWTSGEKDNTRNWHEREHAQTLMGRAFRKYLEEKKSPWLRTIAPPPPVMIQLRQRVHSIPQSRPGKITQWVKRIEEGKEWNWWDDE